LLDGEAASCASIDASGEAIQFTHRHRIGGIPDPRSNPRSARLRECADEAGPRIAAGASAAGPSRASPSSSSMKRRTWRDSSR
jgi:hypothetical protein